MHRGLLIRQVFTMLELLLLVAVAGGAYLLLSRVLDKKPPLEVAVVANDGTDPVIEFFALRTRDEYKPVYESNIFGAAGADSAGVATNAVPDDKAPVPTTLPLKLRGVTALGSKDPMSSALIEDTARKKTLCFFVGQVVKDQVKLIEVHPRQVVLFNPPLQRNEVLKLDDDKKGSIKVASNKTEKAQPVAAAAAGANTITVNKQEISEALATNLETLLAVQPTTVTDENGNVTGLTADNIGTLPLADKLGLQDGDELQQINGQKIDSVDKISEMVQKFSDVGTFRLGIVRGGAKVNLTVKLE
jgi:type II secretion system protein C